MQFTDLFSAAKVSISEPRRGFQMLQSLRLDPNSVLVAFAAVTVVGVIAAELMALIMLRRGEAEQVLLLGLSPFAMTALQFAVGLLSALAILWIGRMFGGHAAFSDALLVVVWMQFILTLVQLLQLVLILVLPPLAFFPGLVALFLIFWLATGFIAEAHGFTSLVKTFFGLIFSGFALIFALAVVLMALGFAPEIARV